MEFLTERTPAGVGILKKCKTCPRQPRCPGVCIDQDKANTRLADYEDTGLTPEELLALAAIGGGFSMNTDQCAHKAFVVLPYRKPAPAYCRRCGEQLKTAYHEERLYSVACSECKTVTLVKAKNPDEAARIVGEPMPF